MASVCRDLFEGLYEVASASQVRHKLLRSVPAGMEEFVQARSSQGPSLDFARKNGIHWIQGFLGDGSASPVPAQYGVEGIPEIFLIGPDGKILARDLRGEMIEQAIQRALGAN